jgi:arsenite methyltransferase
MIKAEFSGIRSKLYKKAMEEYPKARLEDIKVMKEYLMPKEGEFILEIGAGNGFFSKYISERIGDNGKLIVSDPSSEQLEAVKDLNKSNIEILQKGAEDIDLDENSVDAIWSFGAMHHCFNKKEAFENFKSVLKVGGRLVLVDVFEGSNLARHFDDKVDKYCITGHKVEFWRDEMAINLCNSVGLGKPKIIDLNIKWKFESEKEVGKFLYKIHAMTKSNHWEILKGAKDILGIEKTGGKYYLNWPMKIMIMKNGRKFD